MRKIHDETGKEICRYHIGKTGTKIRKGDGTSEFVTHWDLLGWTPQQVDRAQEIGIFSIKPQNVKNYLLGVKTPVPNLDVLECQSCGKADKTVRKTCDPFLAEIHNKYRSIIWCDDCVHRSAMDI